MEKAMTHKVYLNKFEYTCKIIQCIWGSESKHWKLQNRDKYGHTSKATEDNKRARLLTAAAVLLQNQHKLPPKYKKLFPNLLKLQPKHTWNLETWVNTTQQTVYYLLNVNNQADDDPADDTHLEASIPTDTPHPAPQGLSTPVKQAKSHCLGSR
jgi:hypothetical protein